MTVSEYFQRPHLLIAIIVGIIAFLFLALAAAKILFEEESPESIYQPVIATENPIEAPTATDQ